MLKPSHPLKSWLAGGSFLAAASLFAPATTQAQDQTNSMNRDSSRYQQNDNWHDGNTLFDERNDRQSGHTTYDDQYYQEGYWRNQPRNTTWQDGWHDRMDYDPVVYGIIYYWNPSTSNWESDEAQREKANSQTRQTDSRQPKQSKDIKQEARSNQGEERRAMNQNREQNQKVDGPAEQNRATSQRVKLAGTLDGFRRVQIRSGERTADHTFVRVSLRDGESAIVDLGEEAALEDLDLQKGERIQVRGETAQLNSGQEVIRADAISVTKQLTRETSLKQNKKRTLEGEIADFRNIKLGDARKDHLFVKLKLEDGKSAVVDFGPGASMSQLGLDEGDRVIIRGGMAKIDGKSILCAKSMRVIDPLESDQERSNNQS